MISYSIYIVDDDQSVREGMTAALVSDYDVAAFSTAESALKAIKDNPPDLVLLDIGLPGMDGIDALQKIKSESSDILVIMITAYEDIDTVISAMKAGAHDYVVKPIHMEALVTT